MAQKVESLGLKQSSLYLIGDTKSSFKSLKPNRERLIFRKIKKSEYKNVSSLIHKSHSTSKTSIGRKMKLKEAMDYLIMCEKSNYDVYLTTLDNQILGTITPIINNWGVGHIMDISVDPIFQRQGVAKFLYKMGLKILNSKGAKIFTGATNTSEVIGLSKLMNREVSGIIYSTELN